MFLATLLAAVTLVSPVRNPRVAMYSHARPLISAGQIDTAVVKEQAKWDYVITDPARSGITFEAEKLLKRYNRQMMLLGYIPGGLFVCNPGWYADPPIYGCDTTSTNFAWSIYQAILKSGGPVWTKDGEPYVVYGNIVPDFAQPGLATALADTMLARLPPFFNEPFTDGPCISIAFWAPGHEQIDYVHAGFPSLYEWDRAYTKGVLAYRARLRASVGNCGTVGTYESNTGWMWEQYPSGGRTIDMLLAADTLYQEPTLNWITVARNNRPLSDVGLQKEWRFAYASAALTDHAVCALVGSDFDNLRGYAPFWMDEYAVTRKGNSSVDVRNKGWLGQPLGPAFKAGDLWFRYYTNGCVILNDSFHLAKFQAPGMRRIRGKLARNVNNGADADVGAIPPHDGLFLQHR